MLKRLIKFIRTYLPRPLPVGMADFNSWVTQIIELSGLPDNETTRRAAASFILQLRPSTGFISLRKTVALLVKAAANQVAIEVIKLQDESKRDKEANR